MGAGDRVPGRARTSCPVLRAAGAGGLWRRGTYRLGGEGWGWQTATRGTGMEQDANVVPSMAVAAALSVGQHYGLSAADPVVVQETNNVVVWLRPHQVIAKVGTGRDRADGLRREYEVARSLAELGGPVAQPLLGTTPIVDAATGFTVTLWHRLEDDPALTPDAHTLGASLRDLHRVLAMCSVELPDFRKDVRRARGALDDESVLVPLASADRDFLRQVFDVLLPDLDGRQFRSRPLHGEPHDGNLLLTADGIRWIDFESACQGPVEWDLAFLPDEAREGFGDIDEALLDLLSLLNSARVATWCWIQARLPEMRWHGEHHLGIVRESWTSRSKSAQPDRHHGQTRAATGWKRK